MSISCNTSCHLKLNLPKISPMDRFPSRISGKFTYMVKYLPSCSAPSLLALAVSQKLNSPALYCPGQACLPKRGFGWLLCQHRSPWEIWLLWRAMRRPWAHNRGEALIQSQPRNPVTQKLRWRGRLFLFQRSRIQTLMFVYRLLAQSPHCVRFFHNALEVERLCASTTRPAIPCAGGVGWAEPAAVWNVTGWSSTFPHSAE